MEELVNQVFFFFRIFLLAFSITWLKLIILKLVYGWQGRIPSFVKVWVLVPFGRENAFPEFLNSSGSIIHLVSDSD